MTHPINQLRTLPPVLERYELKYVIPSALVEPITQFALAYCGYDHHSVGHPEGFYPVNSLYFDTPGYRFLNLRMGGVERRFNMRVRSYGNGEVGPYFAEIKFKTPTNIKKFRATVDEREWPDFVTEPTRRIGGLIVNDKEQISRSLFQQLATSYAIEPKIFTCYRRRALVSQVDDYARITFDIDMKCRPQTPTTSATPYCLRPDHRCVNYDISSIYEDEVAYGANVVLELKASPGKVPVWMLELIRRFQLKQIGFSKYMHSSLVDNQDRGFRYMDASRTAAVSTQFA